MATWFTSYYSYARNIRGRNPFFGGILAFFILNFIIFFQIFCTIICYYTYVYIFISKINDIVRGCIYLSIYHVLLFFFVWTLSKTYFTPSKRPPEEYYVDKETDEALKSVTPFIKGEYKPSYSTKEQIEQQRMILVEAAGKRGIILAEVDPFELYRYCYICGLIKPDRCRHCSSCGFCVLKFDHHCPFINKCISYKNYKYFFLYIFYATILTFWSGLTSIEGVIKYFLGSSNYTNFDIFMLFFTIIFLGAMFVGVFGNLLLYHLDLIATNQTTCDQLKNPKFRDDLSANYDVGRCENFEQVFGWGLWMLPIETYMEDGIHYKINYSQHFNGTVEIIRRKCVL